MNASNESAPVPDEQSSAPPDVTLVVVAYRRPDLVERCLASIPLGTNSLDLEVVLVDNHGGDGTGSMVAERFPKVDYVDPGRNLGFARACNLAVARGRGRFVLLLNPDAEIRRGAIDALVAFAERHPRAGLVGGRTFSPDGQVDPSSCWGTMTLWSLACYAGGLSWAFKRNAWLDPESLGRWDRDSVREVGVVTGCLLLAERSVWEELGGFDEAFFMYGEDADLTERARAIGYRPCITPDAAITHVSGASSTTSASRVAMANTGRATLIWKRWRGWRRHVALWLFGAGVALRAAAYGFAARWCKSMSDDAEMWSEVWARRREWLPGYPPVDIARRSEEQRRR